LEQRLSEHKGVIEKHGKQTSQDITNTKTILGVVGLAGALLISWFWKKSGDDNKKMEKRVEKLEDIWGKTVDDLRSLVANSDKAGKDKKIMQDKINIIVNKVANLASNADLEIVTESVKNLVAEGRKTKGRLIDLEEGIDQMITELAEHEQKLGEHKEILDEHDSSIIQQQKQTQQISSVIGHGLNRHNSHELDYWHEYNSAGMHQLLFLRLLTAGVVNTKVLNPNYVWNEPGSSVVVERLGKEIIDVFKDINNVHTVNKVMVPLNLYGKHWVGLVVEKASTAKDMKVVFIDPEQRTIPEALRLGLISKLSKENPTVKIEFEELKVSAQKYNNCGPEVIEAITKYCTGERIHEEDVPYVYSVLYEEMLLLGVVVLAGVMVLSYENSGYEN